MTFDLSAILDKVNNKAMLAEKASYGISNYAYYKELDNKDNAILDNKETEFLIYSDSYNDLAGVE